MKMLLLLLLLCVFWGSCMEKSTLRSDSESLIISMDLNNITSIHKINLIDSLDVLRLDNAVMIGRGDKIIRNNDRLFLLDAWISKSVFVYDLKGNLIQQIKNVGQGPEEYLQLTDIFIDKRENVLGLVSRMDKKLFKYDLENLKIKAIEKMPKAFFYLTDTSDGYVGFMNNLIEDKPFNLWFMSKSLELKDGFFKFPSSHDSKASGSIRPFSAYNEKIYYIQPYDFNVYSVNDKEKTVFCRFDFGKNTLPENIKEYDEIEKIRNDYPGLYVEDLYMFQETNNYLVARVVFKGRELLGVFDKKAKQAYATELDPYTDKYFISFGQIVGMDENAIYTLVEAASIKRSIVGKDEYNDFETIYPEQIKNLREKFKHIDIAEEDNPFLIIHYFNMK